MSADDELTPAEIAFRRVMGDKNRTRWREWAALTLRRWRAANPNVRPGSVVPCAREAQGCQGSGALNERHGKIVRDKHCKNDNVLFVGSTGGPEQEQDT